MVQRTLGSEGDFCWLETIALAAESYISKSFWLGHRNESLTCSSKEESATSIDDQVLGAIS
jgi:hypothetical protein